MAKHIKLTAAEKQRRYREKRRQNQQKEAANKAKDRERYHQRKRLVADMTPREHRTIKKKWRRYAQQRSEKIRKITETLPLSPPQSEIGTPGPSGNSSRGRKVVLKNRSKCVRENKRLIKQNATLARKLEKYKKRLQRLKKAASNKTVENDETLTPSSKASKLISEVKNGEKLGQKRVHRMLKFHCALVSSLGTKYRSLNRSKKKVISEIASSAIVKKYKLATMASRAIGIEESRRKAKDRQSRESDKKDLIRSFFLKDGVSRATAGKKETITRNKKKKQIRYLNDSMKNLYKQFLEESGLVGKVSYTTFTRCRPFYVLVPQEESRDTCLCKLHSNLRFKAKKLRENKAIESENIHELVHTKACDKTNARCMYNICDKCKAKKVPTILAGTDKNPVFWWQWDSVVEEREKMKQGQKQVFKVKVTVKHKIHGTIAELEEAFQKEMQDFKTHTYNIRQQNIAYKTCKENMSDSEALFHVDFSENYNCKLSEETQSYHFGASRAQVTLHTGVLYIGGNEKPVSFCSISSSTDHGTSAIWAHMKPVFQFLKTEVPNVKVLHFFTDGPSTQYRQKKNFYMVSHHLHDLGFLLGTWSFFEAGHGKGAADGIGAVIKRTADSLVSHGKDIPDAATLFSLLKDQTTVKLFYVSQAEVDIMDKVIPPNLVTLPETRKIHQLVTSERGFLRYRYVACYCRANQWLNNIQCSCNFEFGKSATVVKSQKPLQNEKANGENAKKRMRYSDVYSSSSEDELDDQALMEITAGPSSTAPATHQTNQPVHIVVNDYVLAEYPAGSNIHYVGKILAIDELVKVDFMRRVSGFFEIPTFVWPDIDDPDIEEIDLKDIISKLGIPKFLRRGRFTFDERFAGLTVK